MFEIADTMRTEDDHMAHDNPFGIDDSQENGFEEQKLYKPKQSGVNAEEFSNVLLEEQKNEEQYDTKLSEVEDIE